MRRWRPCRPKGGRRYDPVAAYCRVSTDQEDQLGSLAHQRQYFEEYIGRQWDWRLVEVFADEGISGTSAVNRPAFQRMMEAAYAGRN